MVAVLLHCLQAASILIPAAARHVAFDVQPSLVEEGAMSQAREFIDEGAASTTRSLLDSPASTGGCTPSSAAPDFECMDELLGGAMTIHYNGYKEGDSGATFGLELPSETGWMAIGFPPAGRPVQMVGSTAVIVTSDAPSGIGVYALNGQSVGAIELVSSASGRRLSQSTPFTISDASVERASGRTFATFTRPFGEDYSPGATESPYLCAIGASNGLAIHTRYSGFNLALASDSTVAGESVGEDLSSYYKAHAWCMALSWGVLAPIGVMMALTMRNYGKASERLGPIWFLGHRVANIAALVLSTIGFAIAVAKFDLQEEDEYHHHKQIGYAVVILGWLQPINAFLRPHPPAPGDKKPLLRLGWEVLHKCSGYAALAMGVANIFSGITLRYERDSFVGEDDRDMWRTIFGVWLALWAVSGLVLWIFGCRLKKKQELQASGSSSASGRSAALDDRARPIASGDGASESRKLTQP